MILRWCLWSFFWFVPWSRRIRPRLQSSTVPLSPAHVSQKRKNASSADRACPRSSTHPATAPNTASRGQKHLRREVFGCLSVPATVPCSLCVQDEDKLLPPHGSRWGAWLGSWKPGSPPSSAPLQRQLALQCWELRHEARSHSSNSHFATVPGTSPRLTLHWVFTLGF